MKIGVLASQGAFLEHIMALRQLGVEAVPIRVQRELEDLDGLIIPGGESTSISRILSDYNLADKIKELADAGMPLVGTCAGMILMANGRRETLVEPLGVIDIQVKRNAFGRQRESFETELPIPVLGEKPFHAVFIRAPIIEQVNSKVEVLAKLEDGTSVAARQGKRLVTAFHPELVDDPRFHQYFLDIVAGRQ